MNAHVLKPRESSGHRCKNVNLAVNLWSAGQQDVTQFIYHDHYRVLQKRFREMKWNKLIKRKRKTHSWYSLFLFDLKPSGHWSLRGVLSERRSCRSRHFHLEAFAAVTHFDLPRVPSTARTWRGGQKKEAGTGVDGLCVFSQCLAVIRLNSVSVVAVYPSAAQCWAMCSSRHPHDLRPKHAN